VHLTCGTAAFGGVRLFTSIFLASAFPTIMSIVHASPSTSNANRRAAGYFKMQKTVWLAKPFRYIFGFGFLLLQVRYGSCLKLKNEEAFIMA
jgi:hypothetical protein